MASEERTAIEPEEIGNTSDRSDASDQSDSAVIGTVEDEELLPAYSEDGVDLTLIRWMLSFTPVERLRIMQQYAASTYRLHNAANIL